MHVTSHMQVFFPEYGWPDTLVSDSGQCYTAIEFRQVKDDMCVHNITSSPHYHQSNGLVERYV